MDHGWKQALLVGAGLPTDDGDSEQQADPP
jgi:hypothetical protein